MHVAFDNGSWALFPTMDVLNQIKAYAEGQMPPAVDYSQVI